jgi:16S rRNA (guanine966-N2)-methyltransferase
MTHCCRSSTSAKFAVVEGFEELERRAYDDTEFVILRATA